VSGVFLDFKVGTGDIVFGIANGKLIGNPVENFPRPGDCQSLNPWADWFPYRW
jgi:hypothetical protein